MKKLYILIVVLCVTSIKLFSQNHSVKLNFGYLYSNIAASDMYKERTDSKDFLYGIGYEYYYKKALSPQVNINYIKIGFDDYFVYINEMGEEYKREKSPYNFDYLTILIGNKFQIGKKLKGYLSIGVSPRILLKANFYYPEEIANILNIERKVDIKNEMNNFDIGIYSTMGIKYNFSHFSMFLETFIDRSLTTYTNTNYMKNFKFYNYYYSVNFGIMYKF